MKSLWASPIVDSGAGVGDWAEPTKGRIKSWICAEKGLNVVGWFGSSLMKVQITGSRSPALGFNFLASCPAGFDDMRFKHAVINDGRVGVVISRTSV